MDDDRDATGLLGALRRLTPHTDESELAATFRELDKRMMAGEMPEGWRQPPPAMSWAWADAEATGVEELPAAATCPVGGEFFTAWECFHADGIVRLHPCGHEFLLDAYPNWIKVVSGDWPWPVTR